MRAGAAAETVIADELGGRRKTRVLVVRGCVLARREPRVKTRRRPDVLRACSFSLRVQGRGHV